MIYSYFVEKLARQSFANVQNHNYDEVLKALAPKLRWRSCVGRDASRC
jgi:hypothetical protein